MKRYLVIFDLNGTLLHRVSNNSDFKTLALNNPNAPQWLDYQFSAKGKKIFMRPNFDKLINGLPEEFHFAFWTSAMKKNAEPIIKHLMQGQNKSPLFCWYRESCTIPNPEKFKESFKDLEVLWNHVTFKNKGKFIPTPFNTILVDDSYLKCHLHPRNALIIPTFDIATMGLTPVSIHIGDKKVDNLLSYLHDYLNNIAISGVDDVRIYLENYPLNNLYPKSS